MTSNPAVDTAVRSKGFVTDNVPWIGEYPMEKGFVTYVHAAGSHLLYHGERGNIDTRGNVLRTLSSSDRFSYAGVSQNGQR